MEAAIIEILKGVPVAAVLFYFAVQFRKDSSDSQSKYDTLVNTIIDKSDKQTTAMVETVTRNSNVMERVERKLDAKH